MFRKTLTLMSLAALLAAIPSLALAAKEKGDQRETCYGCHEEVKSLKEGSKHAKLSCNLCHAETARHLADSSTKPVTAIDAAVCGKCHQDQYDSFMTVDYSGSARKEKGIPSGRSPMMDKLLAPHGFTKEHNEPRGHLFMVLDQFAVDRFAGGRFQYKDGWFGITQTGKTWDVLEDTGKTLPETAKAGNPTCIQCKTSDHLLNWKYMGDPDPRAKWDRTSDIIAVAKDTQNPLGCVHCHDPHGAQPRVVRDGLIQAVSAGAQTFAGKDGQTDLQVVDFRDFRKIGVMQKADSRLMCAQCHVEYNCNPGKEMEGGGKVAFADQRTNHFPLTSVMDLLEHYKKLNFYDFNHAVTGARLIKLQHPEAESFSGSVHDRAGVTCADCHMPPAKNKKGKEFTSHMVIKPKHHVKEACLRCHPDSTAEQKLYQLESMRNYIQGKMRKSEYWLGQLIDTYAEAQRHGVPEDVLAQARDRHEKAHVLWEWWTAENSDGFHNPDLARESLVASIGFCREGVDILNKAIAARSGK